MKRKNLMTAIMCTFCLAVSAVSPMTVLAEEAVTEADSESGEAVEVLERPDYTASDYVELGEYKGLHVTKGSAEVTDDDILQEVTHYVSLAEKLETLTEGTVQKWDTANIDYEGKLNGEAFDGGTAKGFDLEIGSNTFIDGFEEGLIGVDVGQTVDIPLTFPENYRSTDLAGKDVVFTVTVNEIKRAPELTDELVSEISDGAYSDVESYRDSIRSELEPDKELEVESDMKADVLSQLAAVSTINAYPEEVIDYLVNNELAYYKNLAEAYSMEYADFLTYYMGMGEEDFEEQIRAQAYIFMQQELYLKAVAEAEGMEVSDEEFAEKSQEYADQYNYESVEDFISEGGEANIRSSILQSKVLDFLLENAVITEDSEPEAETDENAEAGADEAAATEGDEADGSGEAAATEGDEVDGNDEAESAAAEETGAEPESETASEPEA